MLRHTPPTAAAAEPRCACELDALEAPHEPRLPTQQRLLVGKGHHMGSVWFAELMARRRRTFFMFESDLALTHIFQPEDLEELGEDALFMSQPDEVIDDEDEEQHQQAPPQQKLLRQSPRRSKRNRR